MASSIQLLRSTIAQERPFPGNLLEGQPAVNLNASEPGLFFKAADGSLVKIGPAAITSDGSPPNSSYQGSLGNTIGELWLDKSTDPAVLKVYDGAQWVDAGSGSGGGNSDQFLTRWSYTAVGGETTLAGNDSSSPPVQLNFTPGLEEVFVNGVLLTRGLDYSTPNATSITNLAALALGDEVSVISWTPFNPIEVNKTQFTINVLDYIPETEHAAIRDKTTSYDASADIREAVIAAEGKSLYFPAGLYLVSFTPGQDIIGARSNSEYYGDGPGTVIKIRDGSNANAPGLFLSTNVIFWCSGVSNVRIHNLTIDGNSPNITCAIESPPAIYVINNSSDIQINNVTISSPCGDGVIVGSAGGPSIGGERVTITNNTVISPGRSCYVITEGLDIILSNNIGIDPDNSHVDIETDLAVGEVKRVVVSGNVFRGTTKRRTGFGCTGPGTHSEIIISNNVFENISDVSIGGEFNSRITFLNNVLIGENSGGNKFLLEVIGGLKDSTISQNQLFITSPISGGMWVRGPEQVLISGNVIRGCGYAYALQVDNPYPVNPSVEVSSNKIYEVSAPILGCIYLGVSNSIVSDNTIDCGITACEGITIAGANSIVSGNVVSRDTTTGNNGIYIAAVNGINVTSNQVKGFGAGIYSVSSSLSTISENTVRSSNVGVLTINSSNMKISANTITDCDQEGISLGSGSYTVVDGNVVLNNSQQLAGTFDGIKVSQSNVTLTNNLVSDNQSVKTQGYAIRGLAGTTNCIISGNNLSGNLFGPFVDLPGTAGSYVPKISGTFNADMAAMNIL